MPEIVRGPLRPWVEDLLDDSTMRSDGWFDADLVTKRWHDHLAGTRDSTQALWAVLMFKAWCRSNAL